MLLIVVVFAGCGGDDTAGMSRSGQGVQLSAPVNLADCRDWKQGTVEQRLGTIGAIRDFTGGSVSGTGGSGATLSDDRAYDLFENYCRNDFARGFKLYKLYGRAAAFSGERSTP